MLKRPQTLSQIRRALRRSRVVALIGPRQCGKTTLARQIVSPDSLNYFDLEDPASLARLAEPMTALGSLRGVVVMWSLTRFSGDRTCFRPCVCWRTGGPCRHGS